MLIILSHFKVGIEELD
jgi:hypothetical protein